MMNMPQMMEILFYIFTSQIVTFPNLAILFVLLYFFSSKIHQTYLISIQFKFYDNTLLSVIRLLSNIYTVLVILYSANSVG